MIGTIIGAILVGLVIGALARLVMPGKQNIGVIMTVRLSVVSWRFRYLRVVFSVVIRSTASCVHSASRSRMHPRSSPMRLRWATISA